MMYVLDDYNVGDVRNVLDYRDSALCSYCLCILPKSVMPFPYLQVPSFAILVSWFPPGLFFLPSCVSWLPACVPCLSVFLNFCVWLSMVPYLPQPVFVFFFSAGVCVFCLCYSRPTFLNFHLACW
jgi:hypothetical protein